MPLARGPFLSTEHFLSQLWETMHVSTKLPTRERRPRITPTLASSVCDFETKTNHTPDIYVTKTLLYNDFQLEWGFSFFQLWSWI